MNQRTARLLPFAFLIAFLGCSKAAAPPQRAAPTPPADPATIGTVTGRITAPQPGAVVMLTPTGSTTLPPASSTPSLDQVQMTFVPDVVIAQAGVPVTFHSSDTELHNLNVRNSETRAQEFNRSIMPGGSFEHAFDTPGFYDVHCDIHPAMSATIFVAPTPLAAAVGQDGSFVIENVPPGPYRLTVYNGGTTNEQSIDVVAGDNTIAATN